MNIPSRWSRKTVLAMIRQCGFLCSMRTLSTVGPISLNILGDYLYYRTHPKEIDPMSFVCADCEGKNPCSDCNSTGRISNRKFPEFLGTLPRVVPIKKFW